MHSAWAVILTICATPLCSGHLPFFGYFSANRSDTKEPSKIRLNNSINIFPSRSRPTTRPYELIKYNQTSSKPFKYPVLPMVTQSTVSAEVPKSNISSLTTQFQYVSEVNQSISTPFGIIKTETSDYPYFPTYTPSTSNPLEMAIFQEHISNLTTESQSISTITQSNSPPSIDMETKTSYHLEQPQSPVATEFTVDPIELTIFQKHEFEGEVPDDEYPDTGECVNTTVSLGSGQEIDETRNCTSNTTTSTTETTQEIDESEVESDDSDEMKKRNFNFALGSFIPPVSELPKYEMPAFAKLPLEFLRLKPKIVTLTNYIIKPSTIHVSQYPSCLQLENVYSVCDQNLVTIQPTNVLQDHSTMYKREFSPMGRMNFELRDTSIMQEDELHYPLVRSPSDPKLPSSAKSHSVVDNVLEPGELDYEFEEIAPEITPNLKSASALQSAWSKVEENAISGLKIERIDVIIPSVTTKTHFDDGITATVIAQNCLPLNLNIPFCSSMFVQQIDIEV